MKKIKNKNFGEKICEIGKVFILLYSLHFVFISLCNVYNIMYGKAKKYLSEHGVRPSLQRAAIMNFLMKHRTHPTVDQIYTDLVRRMPTLSRTTVYNTLRVLAEKGVVLSLSLDAEHTHYDGFTEPHAHFICEKCKRIYDLEYSDDIREIADVQPIPGMTITSRIINYSGICPICSGAFDETHNQYYN